MHKRTTIKNSKKSILYVSSSRIDSGFKTAIHSHPNLEIILIVDNKGKIITNNRKIDIKKGDIVLINPNSEHYEVGEGLSFLAIGVDNLNIYLNETFTKKIIYRSLEHKDFQKLLVLYEEIFNEANNEDAYSSQIIDSAFNVLILSLKRIIDIKESYIKDDGSHLVNNIKEIIDNYYSSEMSLEEIAHRLSMSVASICHTFKKETGTTIIEYKINKQIEEACNLLKMTDMSVTEIGFLVGFNDASYFVKTFKNKKKMTPKDYRKSFN